MFGQPMLVAVPLAVAMVAAVAWRHAEGLTQGGRRAIFVVAGVALGVRFAAALVILVIAHQSHWTNVWLNDEASFFLATESLLPNPLDAGLPGGLQHLSGDGYLGITTSVALLTGGVADANSFRTINAGFGALAVVLTMLIARKLFGGRAALIAGLGAALWPDLVLWSATFLRDTLGSLAVLAVWWALLNASRLRWPVLLGFFGLVMVLLLSLRQYLAVAVAAGILAWWIYPVLRRRPRLVLSAAVALLLAVLGVGMLQVNRVDAFEHAIIFRQMATRMEAMGKLYRDPPPLNQPIQQPYRPGEAIALADPNTGWLLTGLVVDSAQPGFVDVSLTDGTDRTVPIGDLELLQDARIPPLELLSWVPPSVLSILVGVQLDAVDTNVAWIGSALAWDVLLALAIIGLSRSRLALRDWLFPMFVVVGTVLALSAIPGTPGNAERHRATQTIPLLLVLASGFVASRVWSSAEPRRRRAGLSTRRGILVSCLALVVAACTRVAPRLVATPVPPTPDFDAWNAEARGMLSDVLTALRTFDVFQAFRESTAADSANRLGSELAWDPPTAGTWDDATHVTRGLHGRADQLFLTVTNASVDPDMWREQRDVADATHDLLDLADALGAYRDCVDRLAPGDAASGLPLLDTAWSKYELVAARWGQGRAELIACGAAG